MREAESFLCVVGFLAVSPLLATQLNPRLTRLRYGNAHMATFFKSFQTCSYNDNHDYNIHPKVLT